MVCLGLATNTVTGLCALWLPTSGASSLTENLFYRKRQNRKPHKPPAQPCRSTQCRLHNTCYILERLNLTLQCTMTYPGPATHTLAELCAQWWPSGVPQLENSSIQQNHNPPQITSPALPQHPVQASPRLLHTAEASLDLAVGNGTPRAGHPHTGRCLCGVVAERRPYD